MKQSRYPNVLPHDVAPYVGAWIETVIQNRPLIQQLVAPYVGAWIETLSLSYAYLSCQVAPYVGAWIETLLRLCVK